MKKTFSLMTALTISATALSQNPVDVHCHNILPDFVAALDAHGAALDETFPLPSWNVDAHIEFMDSAGIKTSVLSMPAPQPFFGDAEECRDIIRNYNEQTAAICRQHPDRFKFVAALPLPDVQLAIDEAEYALDSLGAVGVKLATNSRGQYLGDESLEPLMKMLNERNAVVIIHPHKPVPVNDSIIATAPLAIYEYPAETTRAVINMIARNVPARYPNIKWVIPHCGSFLPMAIPRMKAVLPAMTAKNLMQPVDFDANLAQFYYDLAGAPSVEAIKSMLTITTPDHIMYGSDYPYQPAPVLVNGLHRLEKAIAESPDLSLYMDMFMSGNASRLFNLPYTPPVKEVEDSGSMLVRISEIDIFPEYLDEYMKAALTVGANSVANEEGVICIYPMVQKRDETKVRILEIYRDMDAYRHHLTTPWFQTYKQGTLHMVKNLDLVDMRSMNPEAMPEIFRKMQ